MGNNRFKVNTLFNLYLYVHVVEIQKKKKKKKKKKKLKRPRALYEPAPSYAGTQVKKSPVSVSFLPSCSEKKRYNFSDTEFVWRKKSHVAKVRSGKNHM